MERVGAYGGQQQNIYIRPVQRGNVENVPEEQSEKQTGKDAEKKVGKVVKKQMNPQPTKFGEVATAVELAAKDKHMDRRNVAQKRFGGKGKFVDVTV